MSNDDKQSVAEWLALCTRDITLHGFYFGCMAVFIGGVMLVGAVTKRDTQLRRYF